MIKRPVVYSEKDESIMDADYNVIAHAFRKIGMLTKDYHELGHEIADAINAAGAEQAPTAMVGSNVKDEEPI